VIGQSIDVPQCGGHINFTVLKRSCFVITLNPFHMARKSLFPIQGHDDRAVFVNELFCYRVRKYLGANLAVLGGAHAIVFGGGIGEHAQEIRPRI
jgi:acetate kinase